MTFALLTAVGAAGWFCLKSYWADLDNRELVTENRRLRSANERLLQINRRLHEVNGQALEAISPTRPRPAPPDHRLWSDEVYRRIAKDAGLRLVPDREAHSHETKGSA
jgi:hypothetical protein